MKKIPESFLLNEEDIKEAITLWINQEHQDIEDTDFLYEITFKIDKKEEFPKNHPRNPMITTIITAAVVRKD